MSFCFYPKHEFACPHVNHCPHLGGAALGSLVYLANESGDSLDRLHRQLDATRKSVSDLVAENEALKREVERLKLELKLERQNKFATNRQRQAGASPSQPSAAPSDGEPRKQGAPKGHPGWFRPTPTEYDALGEVAAPADCRKGEKDTHCSPLSSHVPESRPLFVSPEHLFTTRRAGLRPHLAQLRGFALSVLDSTAKSRLGYVFRKRAVGLDRPEGRVGLARIACPCRLVPAGSAGFAPADPNFTGERPRPGRLRGLLGRRIPDFGGLLQQDLPPRARSLAGLHKHDFARGKSLPRLVRNDMRYSNRRWLAHGF